MRKLITQKEKKVQSAGGEVVISAMLAGYGLVGGLCLHECGEGRNLSSCYGQCILSEMGFFAEIGSS
jgi:hypothetical protein